MDSQTIKHIAKLSYLEFSEEELARFAKDLSAIIDYVSELEKVPTENVPASSAPHTSAHNVFRDDAAATREDLNLAITLVEAAPEREDGYVKVKAVL